jgi:hypothetical protein
MTNPYDLYNQQPQASSPLGYDSYNEPYKTYNEPKFPHGGNTEIRVEKVIFVPTGTYEQQWRRPWVATNAVAESTQLYDVVASAYRNHQIAKANGVQKADAKYMVDPMDLAGVSGSFLKPAAQGEIQAYANLRHGWNEQTGRFMMSLLVKRHQAVAATRYVIIGYTNELGFSAQHVSPTMELNINTIFEVRDVTVNHGAGVQTEQQLVQVNQVLVDHGYTGPNEAETIRLRPYEVATSLARLHDPMLRAQGVTSVDTRDIQNGTPAFSNQHHTNPNNYMATVLSGLANGRDLARVTNRNGPVDPYHSAARELRDAAANQDPFIQAISRAGGNGTVSSSFKWRDLLRLDPNAERDEICFIQWRDLGQFVGSVGENMHVASQYTNWNAGDISTQTAAAIANIIPSMLVDLALRKADIFASNMHGMAVCTATNGWGIVSGVNLRPQLEALGQMFYQQVVLPNTFNGGIGYEFLITADLVGEITIKMKLEGQNEYLYVQPAYCSSVMSPVLTTQRDTLDNLSQAFNALQQDVLRPAPVQPLIHDLGYGTQTSTGKRY